MPRIRKKTSKRGTTARRSRIKDKVAESRKKAKRAAKKDVTWKSKKPKDPGIPNNFPYKDQILAEIAEERRQAAEAKARRKEEKKVLRAQQKAALNANGTDGGEGSGGENSDDAEGEEGTFDGVATLGGRTKDPSKSTNSRMTANGTSGSASTTEASGPPLLLSPDLPHLAAVLDKADVVIEILDARDPLAHRSKSLEIRVASKEGQKLLLVLNKIDACPREPTAAWAAHLRTEYPTLFFRAASSMLPPAVTHDPIKNKGKGKVPSDDAWGLDAVSTLLGHWAQEKTSDGPLHVAVVGLANSGKSTFINSLARSATLDVYAPSSSTNGPTTTPHALEVTLELNGKPVVFIDTPGLAWQPSEEALPEDRERHRAQDILLRNRGRIDRLKDPMPAVAYIVSRAETEDLMVLYGLPAFAKGDVDAFLVGVARTHALIKKGGNPDLAGAARLVLRDWSTGKLPRYAVPAPASEPVSLEADPTLATIYAGDAALLERLVPRKELRRSHDLVRLSAGRVDERVAALEAPWFGTDAAAEGESGIEDDEDEDEDEGPVPAAAYGEALESGTDPEEAGDGVESESGESGSIRSEGDDDDNTDDDGGDSGDGQVEDGHLDEDDQDGDGDGDEEDEALRRVHTSSTRKRKQPPPSDLHMERPARPTKKVAFAFPAVAPQTRATQQPPHSFSKKERSPGRRSAMQQAPPPPPVVLPRTVHHIPSRPPPATTKGPLKSPHIPRAPARAPAMPKETNNARKVKAQVPPAPAPLRVPAVAVVTPAPPPSIRQPKRGPLTRKPAANAPTKAQKRKQEGAGEDGAYDFSKFFR